jgi:ribonucleoside-diphosphate reductase alpha chain
VKASENGRRDADHYFGCNPCSEIILRPYQFCNLTEVVCRATDDLNTLTEKVRMATILGTFQSTLTSFKYLRKIWKDNTEEERLLGVSLTGILDTNVWAKEILTILRDVAVETNKKLAKDLGIPQSTAITCVKPSGTVSQLVDSASGIHARHNDYYIRTVRGDNKDPLTQFMKESGIPNEPCVMKPDSTTVFSFPMKSPEGAITRTQMSAIEQLEYWLMFQRHWCEHKPSVTVSVKEDEWMDVGAWVYKNFDEVSGISFLPFSDHTYAQAPYQDITKEEYTELFSKMPMSIDWTKLADFEKEDTTSGGRELACTADACEVVDLTSN